MKSKLTLKQIAIQMGTSVSTVSKALGDSPEISDETKKRIKKFAQDNNYKPNKLALNLKNKSTKTIGVILPNILNPFFAKVFVGIEKEATKRGYSVITCISNESLEKEVNAIEMLSNGSVDGFIMAVSEETQKKKNYDHLNNVISEQLPVVLFDRMIDGVNCDMVGVDDLESAENATQYLFDTGCNRVALLSTIENLSVGKNRAKGYLKALETNKIPVDYNIIINSDDIEDFNSQLISLFEEQNFDAIFALDEHASTMAMKLAIKKGIKIPEELSIIGFADGVWSKRLTPSMSTVSQHAPEIGETAARLLIQNLLESDLEKVTYEKVIIKTELRKRESTRKL